MNWVTDELARESLQTQAVELILVLLLIAAALMSLVLVIQTWWEG